LGFVATTSLDLVRDLVHALARLFYSLAYTLIPLKTLDACTGSRP
jgi:hypothetical protein